MRRTVGAIMIMLGCLLGLGSLLGLLQGTLDLGRITAHEGWTAYAYGRLIGMILPPVLAFFLIRYGARLIKNSQSKNSSA